MKKFLSLVLALVMTMSLVTFRAGAKDFTDGDKINYEEAIDVMSAVKVVDGYTDGSFKPQTQLNRGQAAKIICNMVLGPTTASALKADAAPFKDVAADNTFAGYIAYCVQAGLIDGYTDGTYKPTAPLTGYAFMKYLLGCLGYDKDVEGYNGPNWSINVAKQALAIGLNDGLTEEFDGTKIVTREEACLFAFNAMKATMVQYTDKTEVSAGGVTITTTGNRAEMDNNSIYPDKLGKTGLQFAEKYFKNLRCTDGRDDFGRPVTTWTLKAEKVGTYVNYTQKVGEYTKKVAVSDLYELVGSTTAKHVGSVSADLHVYMNGVDTTEDAGAPKNKASSPKSPLEQVGLDGNPFALTAAKRNSTKVGGTGVVTEVYVDDSAANPEVTIVSYATYLYQASEDYNAKKETVRIGAAGDTDWCLNDTKSIDTLYADDFDIADIKADDYLLVTMAWVNNAWVIKSVAPAETVTGVVNTYSQDGSNVTVGGTKYDYAFSTSSASSDTQKTIFTVGQEAKVVLDAHGNVIGVADAVVNSNYVFIRKTATTSALATTALADAYFTDGTKDEITLKEVLGKKDTVLATAADNTYELTGWYTFSKNSAGKYTLTEADKKYDYQGVNGDGNRANDNVTVSVSSGGSYVVRGNNVVNLGSVYADNATVFVVRESDGTVTSYTGVKNVPDIKTGATNAATVTYLKKANGLLGFVFIELAADATIEGSAKSDLLYVLSYDGRTWIDDNEQYDTYKVLDENAESTSVKTDGMIFDGSKFVTNATKKPYGLYRNTRTNSDGYVTSAPIVGKTTAGALDSGKSGEYVSGKITGVSNAITYSNETIWIDLDGTGSNVDRYVLADDAKIILVSLDADLNRDPGATYEASVLTGKALASAVNGYTITGYYQGVLKSSTSNVITTLYVTVTNA